MACSRLQLPADHEVRGLEGLAHRGLVMAAHPAKQVLLDRALPARRLLLPSLHLRRPPLDLAIRDEEHPAVDHVLAAVGHGACEREAPRREVAIDDALEPLLVVVELLAAVPLDATEVGRWLPLAVAILPVGVLVEAAQRVGLLA